MKQETTNGIVTLTAEEGMWITNSDRTLFSSKVWLSNSDSAENYEEVTEEVKMAREAELQAEEEERRQAEEEERERERGVQTPKTLDAVKEDKLQAITDYDSSRSVNSFFYNGNAMWISYEDRVRLKNRLDAEEAMGIENTKIWYHGQCFELNVAQCRRMLYALEAYSAACYDTTAQHKNEVKALDSIEAIEAYDITIGYPQKLTFGREVSDE